jgi:hypothetical protein
MTKKETWTTIYITNEALEALKDVQIKFWPFSPKYNSEKILALIHFYNENKK